MTQITLAKPPKESPTDGLPDKHVAFIPPPPEPKNNLDVRRSKEEDNASAVTRAVMEPEFHASRVASAFGETNFGGHVTLMSLLNNFKAKAAKLTSNDLSDVEANLLSHAVALDVVFAELSRRAASHMGENFNLMNGYLKLALKAQNQARMTLETLANVKNPPVVYAKQTNINNGGQQQVNNGSSPRAPATEEQNPPNKVVEQTNETPMDPGTTFNARQSSSHMETVDTLDGPEKY